ncbi:MAG: tyrosine-type recombinase/integrase [Blastocatellia bacterium]|nr:tyrosine-type recombinase/integrase [Blastocatellia bacterium]
MHENINTQAKRDISEGGRVPLPVFIKRRYYARIKTRSKDIRRSLGTTDPDLARRNLRALRNEQSQIDHTRKRRLTLSALVGSFLQTINHQKPKTIERKTLTAGRIKSDWPTGSQTQVDAVKPSDVRLWLARYNFGPVSRNLHLACAKEIFDMAVADGVIGSSPAAGLKAMKLDKPIRQTPSVGEFKLIVADIRAQRFNADAQASADFVEFVGQCGLGQAEAGALKVQDVDWQRGTITTFRHKTKSGFVVPIYPQVRALLERLVAKKDGSDHVFAIKDAKRAIAAACRRLNLPAYSHRAFRRMFITRALERGVDVKTIATWQGHKDGGKLILQTYSHINPVHSNRMAELMSDDEPATTRQLEMEGEVVL